MFELSFVFARPMSFFLLIFIDLFKPRTGDCLG